MYDPRRGLYIRFQPDLPHPQNRKQISLDRLRVQSIRSLADDELDYLRSEVRRLLHLPIKSCKGEWWYKKHDEKLRRQDLIHEMQVEYYDTEYLITKKNGIPFWKWVRKYKSAQYHALYGLQYLSKEQVERWKAVRQQRYSKQLKEDWYE
jgi:hypothetical protein